MGATGFEVGSSLRCAALGWMPPQTILCRQQLSLKGAVLEISLSQEHPS